MNLTMLARPVDILWKILESYGISPDPLFRKMHVDPELMEDPNARYPISAINRLHEKAAIVDQMPSGNVTDQAIAEVSSFSRAFKRWTGEAPSVFRHSGRNLDPLRE